mgnify:FL=1
MNNENLTVISEEVKLPSAQDLLEAGVHFGHKTSKWHPRMKPYIFSSRNGVHIFDLEKTLQKMGEAMVFLKGVAEKGGIVLFVGTKPAAKTIVKETAQALGMHYVSERWLGGTLSNLKTISKRLDYFRKLEDEQKTGGWDKYVKKERTKLEKKLKKLQGQLEGIRNLMKIPEALFAVDVKTENLAIKEAKRVKIPVVAICDTANDPSLIDYIIPANDDANSSMKIILETVAENLKNAKPRQ